MDDKDPSPFGYTFSADFFGGSPQLPENGGPSLLSEVENSSLMDFFAQGPWNNSDSLNFGPPAPDAKDDFGWGGIVPPATLHDVSTSISDPTQLHDFHTDQSFAASQSASLYGITTDELQAASTLHNHAHMPQPNGRSYSFHGMPSTHTPTNEHTETSFHNLPMVPTHHGLVNEQLTAVLPNHDAPGSVDADLLARFASRATREAHENHLREIRGQQQPLRRSYTYGTDSAFDESGFRVSSKHETAEAVTKRLMADIRYAENKFEATSAASNGIKIQSPTGHGFYGSRKGSQSDEDDPSDDETADDDDEDDRPVKKRRKSKASPAKNGKARKSISTQGGKNRKASLDDRVSKKKRGSTAGQKSRENLTEEQKRSNHILSEQKRRNLIKNGFKELEELVPEIRNGGLSKSGVLVEAANFLEKLIVDNKSYLELVEGVGG